MPSNETITVRVTSETKALLSRLAEGTQRSKSFLAGEAIRAYAESELEIIEGIKQGLADMKAGRVVPHDKAMKQFRATIKKAVRGKK